MQAQRQKRQVRRQFQWNKIPSARRHFYVYTLLLLGAVVGNNVKNSVVGPVEKEAPVAATTARVEGMKQSVKELYRH